jgi:hypothetical protein
VVLDTCTGTISCFESVGVGVGWVLGFDVGWIRLGGWFMELGIEVLRGRAGVVGGGLGYRWWSNLSVDVLNRRWREVEWR